MKLIPTPPHRKLKMLRAAFLSLLMTLTPLAPVYAGTQDPVTGAFEGTVSSSRRAGPARVVTQAGSARALRTPSPLPSTAIQMPLQRSAYRSTTACQTTRTSSATTRGRTCLSTGFWRS